MTQNENTVFQMQDANGKEHVKRGKKQWKRVTVGGVGAILVGTGAMYAASIQSEAVANADESVETLSEAPSVSAAVSRAATHAAPKMELPEETLQAETVSDDMTFAEAFKVARAEVGTGGVFQWRNGMYGTFTEEEWNGLSDDDKNVFAQRVRTIMEESESDLEPVTDTEVGEEGILDVTEVETEEVDDDVRFLGDDPDADIAEGTVVDVDDEVVDVDLAEDMVSEDADDEVSLQEFTVAQEVNADDVTDYVQNLADDVSDDQSMSTDDTTII